jgi:hypothetical protein
MCGREIHTRGLAAACTQAQAVGSTRDRTVAPIPALGEVSTQGPTAASTPVLAAACTQAQTVGSTPGRVVGSTPGRVVVCIRVLAAVSNTGPGGGLYTGPSDEPYTSNWPTRGALLRYLREHGMTEYAELLGRYWGPNPR